MKIAEKIRGLRHSRNLTIHGLAKRSRLSAGHLHNVENERFSPSIRTLIKIAEGLDTDLQRLLTITSLEVLLEDSLVKQVQPLLSRLNCEARQRLLRTLEAAPKSRRIL